MISFPFIYKLFLFTKEIIKNSTFSMRQHMGESQNINYCLDWENPQIKCSPRNLMYLCSIKSSKTYFQSQNDSWQFIWTTSDTIINVCCNCYMLYMCINLKYLNFIFLLAFINVTVNNINIYIYIWTFNSLFLQLYKMDCIWHEKNICYHACVQDRPLEVWVDEKASVALMSWYRT